MKKDFDYLDLKTLTFIGGQLAKKDKRFQVYAGLGYEKARQVANIECSKIVLDFFKKNKNPDINALLNLVKKLFIELGISELMPTLKELTRITMIKGDTREFISWNPKKK